MMTNKVNDAYRAAASLYARANRTDPFAYGRMMAHLTLGIEFPSEVVKQWKGRLPDAKKPTPTRAVIEQPTKRQLREIVFSNLQFAEENKYDQTGWTAEDIAYDLVAFAADCEGSRPERLLPHVQEWMRGKQALSREIPLQ